jgi:hypothetical protein
MKPRRKQGGPGPYRAVEPKEKKKKKKMSSADKYENFDFFYLTSYTISF